MKTKWFSASLALLGGLAALSLARPSLAQQAMATRDSSANIGAEYRVMTEYLTKITEALQGSNDKDSTVNNLTALPERTGVDLKGAVAKPEETTTRERTLASRGGIEGLGGAGILGWIFSKDFNIDDPFEAPLKSRRVELEREREKDDGVGALEAQVDVPQFSYIVGLSKAFNDVVLPSKDQVVEIKGRSGQDTDGFGAFTFPTENEKKD